MNMSPEAVYVLNRRVYKESSLILDVFSLNYGRLSVIANSALKSKKGWSAMLQVFQPLLIMWTGRSSLKTLVSVEAPSCALTLSGKRLYSAYYLNELLLKLVAQSQGETPAYNSSNLFVFYASSLAKLSSCDDIEQPLRIFEYQLLLELGAFPDLSSDLYGQEIQADSLYSLVLQEGFKPVDSSVSCHDDSGYILIEGKNLLKLSSITEPNFDFSNAFMKQIKRLMRSLINELLGGQTLKSRSFFQTYKPLRSLK